MTGPRAEAGHWAGWPGQDPAVPARWQQVGELLAAGIDVIATVGLASLESLSDVLETITGGPAGATVPDGVVRGR